ncbi:MAG TPA: DnaJ domain-containing protein [Verrucomicrobiae bacterium]|jgi:molecular chaperone DnaJ
MPGNYYVILGVATNATPAEIKAAFRRRAMELHPDRSGIGSEPFIEVQEAYGVLSDPDRRRHYDEQASVRVRRRPWGWSAEPFAPAPRAPESFRDVTAAPELREFGFATEWAEFHPSFDELFERLWSNFDSLSRPKSERLESLTIEVVLDVDQARRGGRVRVNIPARVTCTTCGGRGAVGPYECWRCEGHGALAAEYPLEIPYPPAVRDGYVARVPLARFGIGNFYLTVLFRVTGQF